MLRKGDFTSENILRALIVQDKEGLPFRETMIRIGGDGFLQGFLGLQKKAVMMDSRFWACFYWRFNRRCEKRVNKLLGVKRLPF